MGKVLLRLLCDRQHYDDIIGQQVQLIEKIVDWQTKKTFCHDSCTIHLNDAKAPRKQTANLENTKGIGFEHLMIGGTLYRSVALLSEDFQRLSLGAIYPSTTSQSSLLKNLLRL